MYDGKIASFLDCPVVIILQVGITFLSNIMILVGTSKLCRACSKLLPTRRDVSKKGYPFDITGLTIFIFINPSSSFCLSVLLIARRTRSVSSVNDYKSSPRFPSQVQMWTQLIWSMKKMTLCFAPIPHHWKVNVWVECKLIGKDLIYIQIRKIKSVNT